MTTIIHPLARFHGRVTCGTSRRRAQSSGARRAWMCGRAPRSGRSTRQSPSAMGARPNARVSFAAGDVEHSASSDGNGPVDASLKAIESKVASGAEMLLYSVNAITSGSTESQGEVTVRLQHGGRVVNGVGADPDIVVASAKAYLSALNKLHSKTERVAAQG